MTAATLKLRECFDALRADNPRALFYAATGLSSLLAGPYALCDPSELTDDDLRALAHVLIIAADETIKERASHA